MVNSIQGSMIVLHGPPKVGKTQLAAHFPSPIYWLTTEPGHKYIPEDQKKNIIELQSGSGWNSFVSWLQNPPKKAKTVVVDTITGLYTLCMQAVCEKNGWSHPSEGPHGKGWNAVRLEFQEQFGKLAWATHNLDATLIVIDHSREEIIETTTSNISKISCAMPGQARSMVLPVPDHIWFLGYAEDNATDPKDAMVAATGKRCLYVGGSAKIEAGCRDPNVRVRTIVPLSKNNPYEQINKELYGK